MPHTYDLQMRIEKLENENRRLKQKIEELMQLLENSVPKNDNVFKGRVKRALPDLRS
jgi:chaperonin cofactor prefoldin